MASYRQLSNEIRALGVECNNLKAQLAERDRENALLNKMCIERSSYALDRADKRVKVLESGYRTLLKIRADNFCMELVHNVAKAALPEKGSETDE